MILEAIITTTNADGSINVSPMGPWIEGDPSGGFELRPYETSRTFANLQERPYGVLHVTDDVMLFAQTAIGRLEEMPPLRTAEKNASAKILEEACRWYEFKAVYFETSEPRKNIRCEVVAAGRQRDFWGFNRARHAVLEAAILATRVDFIPMEEIARQFEPLRVIVDKTGGENEKEAMTLLERYLAG